jgi:protein SCO1/2
MRRLSAVFVLLLAACAARTEPLHGSVISPSPEAHAFTLIDQDGKPFSLAQTRGQAVLLYFGFTHCADTCPQTLALLGKARAKDGFDPARVRIAMVTVDPKRDSPASFRAFFKKVGIQATGLTGSMHVLAPVYRAYGVAIQPQKHDIVHTDVIYLIDPNGKLRELVDPKMPLKDIAEDLRTVVN